MTPQKSAVDWFGFRTQSEVLDGLQALRGLYGDPGSWLKLRHLDHGKDGFRQAASIHLDDMAVGRVDFGGVSQRGWARWNITGKGCEWVKDWDAVQDLEALSSAQVKRVDIALTTWEGEVSHETVSAAHASGQFCLGGRPPDMRFITSSNPRAGRTCEVGNRKADKFLRGYEKGFELLSKLPEADANQTTHIDGFLVEGIYRTEVEFKAKTRPISWDVVERRDEYFAGAYPFCATLLAGVEPGRFPRGPERAPQEDLQAALANLKNQWGSVLFTALVASRGDISAVWSQIVGDRHNEALLEAGVLLVDHPWLV